MAANGDHPLLPRHKQTTPTASRPDRPRGPATGYGWRIGKPSGGMVHSAKTTPASIASGPAERLDNRKRVVADKPFSGRFARASIVFTTTTVREEPMTARAGP